MGIKNPIHKEGIYFLTMTVIDWVDVFTRLSHKQVILDSLAYCQKEKDLEIYAWCLMSNHLHLIAASKQENENSLSDILRDFKKFTSKKIVEQIAEEPESRRDWMLNRFEYAGRNDSKIKNYKFWQEGNEAKEIIRPPFFEQKIELYTSKSGPANDCSRAGTLLAQFGKKLCGMENLLDVILAW